MKAKRKQLSKEQRAVIYHRSAAPRSTKVDKRRRKRSYSPVSIHQVVIDKQSLSSPFDDWLMNTVSEHARPYTREDYDRDMMAMVQTMKGNKVSERGIRGLIERIVPFLNPYRKRVLLENMDAILMAKKSKLDRAEKAARTDLEYAARRLTRGERRQLREGKGRRVSK